MTNINELKIHTITPEAKEIIKLIEAEEDKDSAILNALTNHLTLDDPDTAIDLCAYALAQSDNVAVKTVAIAQIKQPVADSTTKSKRLLAKHLRFTHEDKPSLKSSKAKALIEELKWYQDEEKTLRILQDIKDKLPKDDEHRKQASTILKGIKTLSSNDLSSPTLSLARTAYKNKNIPLLKIHLEKLLPFLPYKPSAAREMVLLSMKVINSKYKDDEDKNNNKIITPLIGLVQHGPEYWRKVTARVLHGHVSGIYGYLMQGTAFYEKPSMDGLGKVTEGKFSHYNFYPYDSTNITHGVRRATYESTANFVKNAL